MSIPGARPGESPVKCAAVAEGAAESCPLLFWLQIHSQTVLIPSTLITRQSRSFSDGWACVKVAAAERIPLTRAPRESQESWHQSNSHGLKCRGPPILCLPPLASSLAYIRRCRAEWRPVEGHANRIIIIWSAHRCAALRSSLLLRLPRRACSFATAWP